MKISVLSPILRQLKVPKIEMSMHSAAGDS